MSKLMAFWNNGNPRTVRSGRVDRVTNRTIGSSPDVSIDLYNYTPGQRPGRFQTVVSKSHALNGLMITTTHIIDYQDNGALKERLKNDALQTEESLLNKDYMIVMRFLEGAIQSLPSVVETYRAGVRSSRQTFVNDIGTENDPVVLATMKPDWPIDPSEGS